MGIYIYSGTSSSGYSSAHNSSQLAEYVAATPGQTDPVSVAVQSHYDDFVSVAFNIRLSRTVVYYIKLKALLTLLHLLYLLLDLTYQHQYQLDMKRLGVYWFFCLMHVRIISIKTLC